MIKITEELLNRCPTIKANSKALIISVKTADVWEDSLQSISK